MTDEDDQAREFVRHLFSTADSPPRDVVPGSGPTREDYLRWNETADTIVEVTLPGEVLLDSDGVPNGMTPATTQTVYAAAVVVSTAELAKVGLSPDDVPNLRVLDPPGKQDQP
ncbi:MAG TPA: hypothetical protein VH496_16345 [Mycobacterium sp.]|jgi:hypothetical protein